MRLKPALIMLAVFVLVIGALAVFVSRYEGLTSDEARDITVDKLFPGLDATAVRQIEITSPTIGKTPVVLTRAGEHKWSITAPVKGLGSADVVGRLLKLLAETEAERGYATTSFERYKLDEPKYRVAVMAGGAVRVLELGMAAPRVAGASSESYVDLSLREIDGACEPEPHRYARVDGKDQVLIIRDDVRAMIDVPPDAFREARLVYAESDGKVGPVKLADVRSVEITRPDGTVALARQDDGNWRLTKPVDARADRSIAIVALQHILILQAALPGGFVKADSEGLGLDKPAVTVALSTKGGKTHTVRFGAAAPGGTPEAPLIYARSDARDVALKVPAQIVDGMLQAKAEAFRDRRLVVLDRDSNHTVVFERHGRPTVRVVRRTDDKTKWQIAEPVWGRANSGRVNSLIYRCGTLAVEPGGYVDEAPKDLAKYGLAKPRMKAAFTRTGEKKPYATILIGDSPDGAGHLVYAKNAAEPSVVLLMKGAAEEVKADPEALRTRELLEGFDRWTVYELAATQGGKTARLSRGEQPKWAFIEPKGLAVEYTAPSDFLAAVANLHVLEFAADKPKDYAPFGLAKPRAVLEVKTAATQTHRAWVHTLQLGKRTADGKRCYARLPSESNVYEIDVDVLSRVEKGVLEFRDRGVLELDRKRMTAMRIRNSRATYAAQLGPAGRLWLLDKPLLAIGDKPSFVALVDLTTALRAKELISEGGLSNPAYGLAKPFRRVDLTLAAKEKGGKASLVTLAVGSKHGDEGDRYAAVLGTKLVFVMAAGDIEKLDAEFVSDVVVNHVAGSLSRVKVVHRDGSQLAIARQERDWAITSHRGVAADRAKTAAFVKAAGWITAKRFVTYNQDNLARYGLDKPLLTIGVRPRGKLPTTLHIGKALTEKTRDGERKLHYATGGGVPAVFLLSDDTVTAINKHVEDLIEKR
jgi:uncharacterized protein DUF4340